jgi:hypothetical protein
MLLLIGLMIAIGAMAHMVALPGRNEYNEGISAEVRHEIVHPAHPALRTRRLLQ